LLRLVGGIVLRRLLSAVPLMLAVSIVVFVVLRLLPADPVGMMLPPNATRADAEALRAAFGLDKSIAQQFWIWLLHAVRGDLGISIRFHEPVTALIARALPATIELALAALALALAIGVPGGLLLYALRGERGELSAGIFVVMLLSIPSFLWALFLMLVFGVAFPLLPFTGRIGGDVVLSGLTGFALIDTLASGHVRDFVDAMEHLLLPALALALGFAPLVMRVLRSSLIEAATEDYVMVARLRGVSEGRILVHHMLKNAALPTVTLIGVQFGFLFGGTLLVELIYSFPGLGNLMVQAVRDHDLPLLQGVAAVFCVAVLIANTLVDALYVVLNPRLRRVQ
jgi:ABC-type dipeptide/oligopeptide/nickel transport system permease component